jgi:hypothetical protein
VVSGLPKLLADRLLHLDQIAFPRRARLAVDTAIAAARAALLAPGRELPREGTDYEGGRESNGYGDDQGLKVHGDKIKAERLNAKWSEGGYP